MIQQEFFSDLHIHTNRSFCAPSSTTVESYLPLCEKEGLRVLGISDHVYPTQVIRNRGFADKDKVSHLTSLRGELKKAQEETGIRLLLGCEMDLFPSTGPLLSPEEGLNFDYILVAASHILNYPKMYADYDLSTPAKLRKLTLDQFFAACELRYPVPVGICHPLYPICSPWEQEVVDGISDTCLNECFSMAAERDISIEIHACLYRNGTALNEYGLSDSYLRVLSAAKNCGCKFHFGADAHNPDMFADKHDLLRKAAELIGITAEDLWEPARGILHR